MERGLAMIKTQAQLLRNIEQQLDNLSYVNEMLFDYWLTELCDENEELIPAKCSEEILSQLEKDVYDNEV
jgi:hypothetical protein